MSIKYEPIVRTRVLVREVMNSPVLTVPPDENIRSISQKMSDARVGSVIVFENELPLGIVTDGDIVSKVVRNDRLPSIVKAKDIMSAPLQMIESEKEIIEAARRMRSARLKRLGVTYKKNLVGIISISDILAVTPELFEIISETTRIVTSEGIKQTKSLAGYCDNCNQWSDGLLEVDDRFICEECGTGGQVGESAAEQTMSEPETFDGNQE